MANGIGKTRWEAAATIVAIVMALASALAAVKGYGASQERLETTKQSIENLKNQNIKQLNEQDRKHDDAIGRLNINTEVIKTDVRYIRKAIERIEKGERQ